MMIKKLPKYIIVLFLMMFLAPATVFAQLERERADTGQSVELTFMAPKNINLYTVEPLAKGELHYSIMHTFGEVNTGVRNLWGVDQGANVRFSFEYGFNNSFSLGFGRSSMDKVYDFMSRISLLKQTRDSSIPVSISFVPAVGINTSSFGFLDQDYSLTDRLNFGFSLPIAKKVSSDLSVQLSPMLVHFNRVGAELNIVDPQVNTYYSLGLASRYRITPRTALSLQYVPPVTDAQNLDHNLAVGIDIETGGHVFQMFFTTSRALNDQYLLAGSNGNFFEREFRFGFNINRLFNIR